MARVDLRCGSCGYVFFTTDAQIGTPEGLCCPSCRSPVGLDGPSSAPQRRPEVRVISTSRPSSTRTLILGSIVAGVVLVVGIVVILMLAGRRGGDEEAVAVRNPVPAPSAPPAPRQKSTLPVPAPAPRVQTPPPAPPPRPAASVPLPVPPPAAAVPPADAVTGPRPLPPEIAAVPKQVLGLHPYYVQLLFTPTDRTRLERIAAAGKGEPEDVEFVRKLAEGTKLRVVKDEISQLEEALRKLEPEALENLPTDKVLMNDGRSLLGKVVEETPEAVRLERKFAGGVGGVMPLRREDVKAVQKGAGPGAEFARRWEAAKAAGVPELSSLLSWCKENTLLLQTSLVASRLALKDPSRTDARMEASLPADPIVRALEAEKQGGFITYQGRRWVPRELKDKLFKDGYRIIEGQWFARKERMISIPGLFRYEDQKDRPVLISGSGASQAHDVERVYSAVQDVSRGGFVEKSDLKLVRRFWTVPMTAREVIDEMTANRLVPTPNYQVNGLKDHGEPPAGKALTGEVYITVPLGAPVLEAWVTTLAEVKPGGSISVHLLHDGGRQKIYDCKAKEEQSHALPGLIKGKTQIDLVAEIAYPATYTEKLERRKVKHPVRRDQYIVSPGLEVFHARLIPDYLAVLFPSNSNTVEVFRLKFTTADPAPGIDKLFENARDVLRD